MNWKGLVKFDAHVHVAELFGACERDEKLANADIDVLLKAMDSNNIEKALLLPINNSRLFYDMREANEFMAMIKQKAPDRLFAFADLSIKDSQSLYETPVELEYAVKELGLNGLKIHPSNLNIPADDLRLVPVLRKAAELKIPVMYHSNPWGPGFYDMCSPERINHMIKIFPDINFITAHLGGMRHLDAIKAVGSVDISYSLIELVELYGIQISNRILRKFGADRLIFGSDFPEAQYDEYFEILDNMDFTDEEKEKIAYKNISSLLECSNKI